MCPNRIIVQPRVNITAQPLEKILRVQRDGDISRKPKVVLRGKKIGQSNPRLLLRGCCHLEILDKSVGPEEIGRVKGGVSKEHLKDDDAKGPPVTLFTIAHLLFCRQ